MNNDVSNIIKNMKCEVLEPFIIKGVLKEKDSFEFDKYVDKVIKAHKSGEKNV